MVKPGGAPSGYSCTANNAGVPATAVSCSGLTLDPSTGITTLTLPAGVASLVLDFTTGAVSGTFTPATGPTTTLAGSRR